MLKIYCQKCGSKNEYAKVMQKPNYCQSCGNCFNPNLVKENLVKEKLAATKLEVDDSDSDDDDYDDDETVVSVPNLEKIDIDVDYGRPKTDSFKNLAGTRNPEQQDYNSQEFNNLQPRPRTQEELMDEFQREASTLRPKKRSQKPDK